MSQGALAVPSGSGAAVRAGFNAVAQRLASKGSGTSRPADIVAGEHWIETDNPGGGVWALWLFDGASDILDAIIDSVTHAIHRVTGQIVSTHTGAVATGTTQLPLDDTIPQNTEGDQYMSQAITPLRAGSDLYIDVVFLGAFSANAHHTVALFQDSTANALKAVPILPTAADACFTVAFRHKMTAGTTSSTTFKVRSGGNSAGTTTFNGRTSARLMGGVAGSSITVTEKLA